MYRADAAHIDNHLVGRHRVRSSIAPGEVDEGRVVHRPRRLVIGHDEAECERSGGRGRQVGDEQPHAPNAVGRRSDHDPLSGSRVVVLDCPRRRGRRAPADVEGALRIAVPVYSVAQNHGGSGALPAVREADCECHRFTGHQRTGTGRFDEIDPRLVTRDDSDDVPFVDEGRVVRRASREIDMRRLAARQAIGQIHGQDQGCGRARGKRPGDREDRFARIDETVAVHVEIYLVGNRNEIARGEIGNGELEEIVRVAGIAQQVRECHTLTAEGGRDRRGRAGRSIRRQERAEERENPERHLVRDDAQLHAVLLEEGHRLTRDHLSGGRYLGDGGRREEEDPQEEPGEEQPRPARKAEKFLPYAAAPPHFGPRKRRAPETRSA